MSCDTKQLEMRANVDIISHYTKRENSLKHISTFVETVQYYETQHANGNVVENLQLQGPTKYNNSITTLRANS